MCVVGCGVGEQSSSTREGKSQAEFGKVADCISPGTVVVWRKLGCI